jgi:hypothetical protein
MPSKNNLSALKQDKKPNPILPARAPEQVQARPQESTQVVARPAKQKAIGRPRKPLEDKRDYKVTLSLTRAEGAKIKDKAGLAGEATYLYDLLKKAGAFS